MSHEQLQPDETLDYRGVDDILDEGISPPEKYRGVTAKGVTAREELEGETIDERLRQEEPDVWAGLEDETDVQDDYAGGEVGDRRTGRLMAPDEGSHEDVDSEMYAEDEGIDGAGASAEEAAMHTIDDEQA